MRRVRLIRSDRPSVRPGYLSNLDLWEALRQAEGELIAAKQAIAILGDVLSLAISQAMAEAYPGKDIAEIQGLIDGYLQQAEKDVAVAQLERAVEAS